MDNIRGIECMLDTGCIKELLLFFFNKSYAYYVRWCMKISNRHELLPNAYGDYFASQSDLEKLAGECIWELILDIYPVGSETQTIETYDDFLNSSCICCLIYYDCGMLDIYVKDPELRNQLYSLLRSTKSEDLRLITDSSDGRTAGRTALTM